MDRKVRPVDKLQASIQLPPDKSISHRAAMFASLYNGSSEIHNYSSAADPQSTLNCLEQLGIPIEREGDSVIIEGRGREGFTTPQKPLDCGNSGTTMRLLSGIVGGAGISCTLIGDESLSARDMKRIIDPLRSMGIDIEGRDGNYAPLSIGRSGSLKPIEFELPIPSAQLKSCVLLAGLFGDGVTKVIEKIPSRDHTERLLDLPEKHLNDKKVIGSSRAVSIPQQSYTIPNDFSAAAFWLVAGSIHPKADITMNGVGVNPSRTAAMDILRRMGAQLSIENERREGFEPVADLRVSGTRLKPVTIGEELVPNCIDEIPILAIAMLFADGTSSITGAAELRHKETDRLAALADMLQRAGADFEVFEDGLHIHGSPDFIPAPSEFNSFDDHRIAMSAAVLALMGKEPSTILDADCTAVSYPAFWNDMELLTN